MELQVNGQYDSYMPGMMFDEKLLTEKSPLYDSRYRNIILPLETIIELGGSKLPANLLEKLNYHLNTITTHIESENKVMELTEFPQAMKHQSDHLLLLAYTTSLCYGFSSDPGAKPNKWACVRLLWLKHIQVHDRALEQFLTVQR